MALARIAFSWTPESIAAAAAAIERTFHASLDAIASATDTPTFDNTFGLLATAEAAAAHASSQVTLPAYVAADRAVRSAGSECKERLRTVFESTWTRSDLFTRLAAAAPAADAQPELDEQDRRFVADTLRRFRLAGAALPEAAARARVAETRSRVAALAAEFERNLNEDTTRVSFAIDQLAGCSLSFIESLAPDPTVPGAVLVELKAPHVGPVMTLAEDDHVRYALYMASNRKCAVANGPLLDSLVAARATLARELGLGSHAEAVLQSTMIRTPQAVDALLRGVARGLKPALAADLAAMRELNNDAPVRPWQVPRLIYLRRIRDFALDEEAVRQYFPLAHVLPAALAFYESLLGLRCVEVGAEAGRWHEDVRVFDVFDAHVPTDAAPLGRFYMDLHSRPGKYGHQCVFPVSPSCAGMAPEAAILGNLSRTTLRFPEVVTLCHELGHVFHCVCTRVRYARFSWAWSIVPYAAGVEMDVLELPSMMFESFIYSPEMLRRLSKHQHTGEVLPQALVSALCASRDLAAGYSYTRMAAMSLLDQHMHGAGASSGAAESIPDAHERLCTELGVIAPEPGTHFAASWYHMVQGYDANYYSYLAAEVLAQDCFARFEASPRGVLDPELGLAFRRKVLSVGAALPGERFVRDFLQAEPSSAPFLKRLGIAIERSD